MGPARPIGAGGFRLQIGPTGYEARQATGKTGPHVSLAESKDRYAINALGLAVNMAFPKQKASVGFKYFKEFADRSTFQGNSLQVVGAISF